MYLSPVRVINSEPLRQVHLLKPVKAFASQVVSHPKYPFDFLRYFDHQKLGMQKLLVKA